MDDDTLQLYIQRHNKNLLQLMNDNKQIHQMILSKKANTLFTKWNKTQQTFQKLIILQQDFHKSQQVTNEIYNINDSFTGGPVQIKPDADQYSYQNFNIQEKSEANQSIIQSYLIGPQIQKSIIPSQGSCQQNIPAQAQHIQQIKKIKKHNQPLENNNIQLKTAIIQSIYQEPQTIQIEQNLCLLHTKKIWYNCLNQKKNQKQLCNMCIMNTQNHINHKIVCRKHNQGIKAVLVYNQQLPQQSNKVNQSDQQGDQQIFICQKCQNHKYSYKAICEKHFCRIPFICFNEQCIQNDCFLICNKCQQRHKHEVSNFDKDTLLQKLRINREFNMQTYDKYLLLVKQKIQMSSFIKIFNTFNSHKSFLSALTITNEENLKQEILRLIKNRKKEQMMVLFEVNNLNQKQRCETHQRGFFLQVLADQITQLYMKLYQFFQEYIKQYNLKIINLLNLKPKQIEQRLNKKYKKILLNQIDYQQKPFHTYQQIDNHHYHRVQQIITIMPSQQIERDFISLALKAERFSLHTHIQDLEKTDDPTIQQKIQSLFYQPNRIQFDQEDKGQKDNCLPLIEDKIKQYKKCSSRQQKYQHQLSKQFQFVSKYQLNNLQQIKIIYTHQSHLIDQKSVISAFKIFQLIQSKQRLRDFQIDGVQITYFQEFIKKYSKQNPSSKFKHIKDHQDQTLGWMKGFKLKKTLKLSLCASIQLIVKNKARFNQFVTKFAYFISDLQYVSNIKIDLDLSGNPPNLANLSKTITKIHNKRIGLHNYHFYEDNQNENIQPFIKDLSTFKDINQFDLYRINCDQTPLIEQYFTQIIQNVQHLKIESCKFNIRPKMKSVQTLALSLNIFSYEFIQNIQNPKLLKKLKLYQKVKTTKEIDFEPFNQLQFLAIKCNNFSQKYLKNISRISPTLKYLTLCNDCNIQESSQQTQITQSLFQQLSSIIKLHLCNILITPKNISSIPFLHLQEIYLEKCKCTTNRMMKKIDQTCRNLKRLSIKQEQNYKINESDEKGYKGLLYQCKYVELIHLKINKKLLSIQDEEFIRELRNKGTIVVINK